LAGAYLIVTCKYRNNVVSIQYSQPGNKLLTYTKMKGGGSRRSSPHFGLRCGDCRGCLFSSTSHRLHIDFGTWATIYCMLRRTCLWRSVRVEVQSFDRCHAHGWWKTCFQRQVIPYPVCCWVWYMYVELISGSLMGRCRWMHSSRTFRNRCRDCPLVHFVRWWILTTRLALTMSWSIGLIAGCSKEDRRQRHQPQFTHMGSGKL